MSSELQVIDLQPGDGKAVVKGALITTQYRGFLESGHEFDSSYRRGKAFQCVIGTGRVVPASCSAMERPPTAGSPRR